MKNIVCLIVLFMAVPLFSLSQSTHREDQNHTFGRNTVAAYPFYAFASNDIGDAGIGISYERYIHDILSVKVPFGYGLNRGDCQTGIAAKLYPKGHEKVFAYAISPAILYSHSKREVERWVNDGSGNGYFILQDQKNTQLGFALINSLNFTILQKIYLGVDMGLGINYLERTKLDGILQKGNSLDGFPNLLINFGFGIGYRF